MENKFIYIWNQDVMIGLLLKAQLQMTKSMVSGSFNLSFTFNGRI